MEEAGRRLNCIKCNTLAVYGINNVRSCCVSHKTEEMAFIPDGTAKYSTHSETRSFSELYPISTDSNRKCTVCSQKSLHGSIVNNQRRYERCPSHREALMISLNKNLCICCLRHSKDSE